MTFAFRDSQKTVYFAEARGKHCAYGSSLRVRAVAAFPGASGPKYTTVGRVIFTVPRRNSVSHAVATETSRDTTAITLATILQSLHHRSLPGCPISARFWPMWETTNPKSPPPNSGNPDAERVCSTPGSCPAGSAWDCEALLPVRRPLAGSSGERTQGTMRPSPSLRTQNGPVWPFWARAAWRRSTGA